MPLEPSVPEKPGILLRFISWWPFIRLVLEALSVAVLFCHLIPEKAIDKLKENFLGIFIIGGITLITALFHAIQQSQLIKSMDSRRYEETLQKDGKIKELEDNIAEKQNAVKQIMNYKNTFALNNKTFASLRDSYRDNLISNDKNELKSALREFCNNVNEIFSDLKGTENRECHVCIKILTQPANRNQRMGKNVKVKVKTLMRDGRGDGTRSKIDSSKIDHLVSDNTDFLAIFDSTQGFQSRCFMSNDLMVLDGYRNSSFKKYNKGGLPYHVQGTQWPLAYRSCITAPICPGTAQPDLKDGTLIGFLCVDFVKPNHFEETDVIIACGLAEGLYDALDHYIKKYFLKA